MDLIGRLLIPYADRATLRAVCKAWHAAVAAAAPPLSDRINALLSYDRGVYDALFYKRLQLRKHLRARWPQYERAPPLLRAFFVAYLYQPDPRLQIVDPPPRDFVDESEIIPVLHNPGRGLYLLAWDAPAGLRWLVFKWDGDILEVCPLLGTGAAPADYNSEAKLEARALELERAIPAMRAG